MKRSFSKALLCAWIIPIAAGCGVLVGNPDEKTGGDEVGKTTKGRVTHPDDAFTPPAATGLIVHLMDAPVDDAKAVNIKIAGVEAYHEEHGWIKLAQSSDEVIDLLALQSGRTFAIVDGDQPPEGNYQELRLILDETYVSNLTLADNTTAPLRTPSGEQSGLKLKVDFSVSAVVPTEIVLDFDLRQSIKRTGKSYLLTPVLRAVEKDGSGFIVGNATKGAVACLYQEDKEPDTDSDCAQALVSAVAREGDEFTLAFVPVGDYKLRVFEGGEIRDYPVVITSRETTRVD